MKRECAYSSFELGKTVVNIKEPQAAVGAIIGIIWQGPAQYTFGFRGALMAAKRPVVAKKKIAGRKRASLRPTAPPQGVVSPAEIDLGPEQPAVLDPSFLLTKFNGGKTRHQYQANAIIFAQGETADAVFYIESGKVKITVLSKQGREAVVAILPKASFFGEGSLAGQPLRMATASTVEPSIIVRVEKRTIADQLHREPKFAERFLAYVLSRNIRMEADLVDHLFNSSEKRLARLLLLLANFGHESRPLPIVANMSQETLAEMIGTTRSRVSYFLNRFRDLGFIDYDSGGMHVHSSLVSVVLHD
jgi:CRP/FNR family cyclic AMP-dependent transcriptional regulator